LIYTIPLVERGRSGGIGRPACRQAGAHNDLKVFYVYVLKSVERNYIYVRLTNSVERRLSEHNKGKERTTRAYRPFDLLFTESFVTRVEARKREKYLKSGCGKEWIKNNH